MWLYELFGFVTRITWLPALCFVVGFGLLTFELFNPGFGVPGFSGIVLLILGIIFTARSLVDAIVIVILILLVIGIIIFFIARSASKGNLSKKLILKDALKEEFGYSGRDNLESFLGKTGIAATVLRPSGIGIFDDIKLDIVTEGEFIPKGSNIEIVRVEGMRVIVRKLG